MLQGSSAICDISIHLYSGKLWVVRPTNYAFQGMGARKRLFKRAPDGSPKKGVQITAIVEQGHVSGHWLRSLGGEVEDRHHSLVTAIIRDRPVVGSVAFACNLLSEISTEVADIAETSFMAYPTVVSDEPSMEESVLSGLGDGFWKKGHVLKGWGKLAKQGRPAETCAGDQKSFVLDQSGAFFGGARLDPKIELSESVLADCETLKLAEVAPISRMGEFMHETKSEILNSDIKQDRTGIFDRVLFGSEEEEYKQPIFEVLPGSVKGSAGFGTPPPSDRGLPKADKACLNTTSGTLNFSKEFERVVVERVENDDISCGAIDPAPEQRGSRMLGWIDVIMCELDNMRVELGADKTLRFVEIWIKGQEPTKEEIEFYSKQVVFERAYVALAHTVVRSVTGEKFSPNPTSSTWGTWFAHVGKPVLRRLGISATAEFVKRAMLRHVKGEPLDEAEGIVIRELLSLPQVWVWWTRQEAIRIREWAKSVCKTLVLKIAKAGGGLLSAAKSALWGKVREEVAQDGVEVPDVKLATENILDGLEDELTRNAADAKECGLAVRGVGVLRRAADGTKRLCHKFRQAIRETAEEVRAIKPAELVESARKAERSASFNKRYLFRMLLNFFSAPLTESALLAGSVLCLVQGHPNGVMGIASLPAEAFRFTYSNLILELPSPLHPLARMKVLFEYARRGNSSFNWGPQNTMALRQVMQDLGFIDGRFAPVEMMRLKERESTQVGCDPASNTLREASLRCMVSDSQPNEMADKVIVEMIKAAVEECTTFEEACCRLPMDANILRMIWYQMGRRDEKYEAQNGAQTQEGLLKSIEAGAVLRGDDVQVTQLSYRPSERWGFAQLNDDPDMSGRIMWMDNGPCGWQMIWTLYHLRNSEVPDVRTIPNWPYFNPEMPSNDPTELSSRLRRMEIGVLIVHNSGGKLKTELKGTFRAMQPIFYQTGPKMWHAGVVFWDTYPKQDLSVYSSARFEELYREACAMREKYDDSQPSPQRRKGPSWTPPTQRFVPYNTRGLNPTKPDHSFRALDTASLRAMAMKPSEREGAAERWDRLITTGVMQYFEAYARKEITLYAGPSDEAWEIFSTHRGQNWDIWSKVIEAFTYRGKASIQTHAWLVQSFRGPALIAGLQLVIYDCLGREDSPFDEVVVGDRAAQWAYRKSQLREFGNSEEEEIRHLADSAYAHYNNVLRKKDERDKVDRERNLAKAELISRNTYDAANMQQGPNKRADSQKKAESQKRAEPREPEGRPVDKNSAWRTWETKRKGLELDLSKAKNWTESAACTKLLSNIAAAQKNLDEVVDGSLIDTYMGAGLNRAAKQERLRELKEVFDGQMAGAAKTVIALEKSLEEHRLAEPAKALDLTFAPANMPEPTVPFEELYRVLEPETRHVDPVAKEQPAKERIATNVRNDVGEPTPKRPSWKDERKEAPRHQSPRGKTPGFGSAKEQRWRNTPDERYEARQQPQTAYGPFEDDRRVNLNDTQKTIQMDDRRGKNTAKSPTRKYDTRNPTPERPNNHTVREGENHWSPRAPQKLEKSGIVRYRPAKVKPGKDELRGVPRYVMNGYKVPTYETVKDTHAEHMGKMLVRDGIPVGFLPKTRLPTQARGHVEKLGLAANVAEACFTSQPEEQRKSTKPCSHAIIRFFSDMMRLPAYKALGHLLKNEVDILWVSIGGYYHDEINVLKRMLTPTAVPKNLVYVCYRPRLLESDEVYTSVRVPESWEEDGWSVEVVVVREPWTGEDNLVLGETPSEWLDRRHEWAEIPTRDYKWFSTCFDVLYYLPEVPRGCHITMIDYSSGYRVLPMGDLELPFDEGHVEVYNGNRDCEYAEELDWKCISQKTNGSQPYRHRIIHLAASKLYPTQEFEYGYDMKLVFICTSMERRETALTYVRSSQDLYVDELALEKAKLTPSLSNTGLHYWSRPIPFIERALVVYKVDEVFETARRVTTGQVRGTQTRVFEAVDLVVLWGISYLPWFCLASTVLTFVGALLFSYWAHKRLPGRMTGWVVFVGSCMWMSLEGPFISRNIARIFLALCLAIDPWVNPNKLGGELRGDDEYFRSPPVNTINWTGNHRLREIRYFVEGQEVSEESMRGSLEEDVEPAGHIIRSGWKIQGLHEYEVNTKARVNLLSAFLNRHHGTQLRPDKEEMEEFCVWLKESYLMQFKPAPLQDFKSWIEAQSHWAPSKRAKYAKVYASQIDGKNCSFRHYNCFTKKGEVNFSRTSERVCDHVARFICAPCDDMLGGPVWLAGQALGSIKAHSDSFVHGANSEVLEAKFQEVATMIPNCVVINLDGSRHDSHQDASSLKVVCNGILDRCEASWLGAGVPQHLVDWCRQVNCSVYNKIFGYVGAPVKRNLVFEARTYGTVTSGNAAQTTTFNTFITLSYADYAWSERCRKLRKPYTSVCDPSNTQIRAFAAGDDLVVFCDGQLAESWRTEFRLLSSPDKESRAKGLGICYKTVEIEPWWKVDFLSKVGFLDGTKFRLVRPADSLICKSNMYTGDSKSLAEDPLSHQTLVGMSVSSEAKSILHDQVAAARLRIGSGARNMADRALELLHKFGIRPVKKEILDQRALLSAMWRLSEHLKPQDVVAFMAQIEGYRHGDVIYLPSF